MNSGRVRIALAAALVVVLIAGIAVLGRAAGPSDRTTVTAYFANTNGMFVGDEVRVLGVAIGRIEHIEPQPERVAVTFSYDAKYKVPADAKAVILSPSLVTSRAIQLTPAYRSGPMLRNDAVIPLERTAVPVEFDDLRRQLERLTESLQPTEPGGVSTLGAFINTTADNLRGEGGNFRDTIVKLSQAFSALGDRSTDLFSTIKNLSILVSALQSSTDLMRQLNANFASVTGLLSNGPDELGEAIRGINDVAGDVSSFVSENREAVGTTSDKLASVTKALVDSEDDIKQTLHIAPNTFQNFINIYQPAQATFSGVLALNNFTNPVSFLCGAVQAASRMGAEQSAKLCAQYLAPIIKNRQYNFPPIGQNLFVGAQARPNEVTYSEDSMRPDYVPPAPTVQPPTEIPRDSTPPSAPDAPPLPAEAQTTNPAAGLPGLMVPAGGGS